MNPPPDPTHDGPRLVTVGHGQAGQDELAALLVGADVEVVVDVRRFPGSRNHPQFSREALERWLPERHVAYRWDERLGGRRRLPKDHPVLDPWWTVAQFAAYAAHTRTDEFRAGLADLLSDVADRRTAVMCSETVWWRCHRRLVADVALLGRGIPVDHLMHDGKLRPHRPSDGARLVDGELYWDLTTGPS